MVGETLWGNCHHQSNLSCHRNKVYAKVGLSNAMAIIHGVYDEDHVVYNISKASLNLKNTPSPLTLALAYILLN